MGRRVALIDGDILAHQAASRVERPVQWTSRLWTLHSNLDEAIARVSGYVSELKRETESDKVIMALSDYGGPRWRKDILPTYKENRKPKRKPVVYHPLRDAIKEIYETFERPRLEGDDVLGILATHPGFYPDSEKIVLSMDKDLKTIPGLLVNWRNARKSGDWTPTEITEKEADRFFMRQTLMGDRTDGYKGCPGIGKVRSDRLLPEDAPIEEMWPLVLEAFRDKDLGGMALPTAQVARICRWTDYDYDAKEVLPWTPPAASVE